jgi:indole-3-glycerol phosphate synthase
MPTELEKILAHTLLEVMDRKVAADMPLLERRAAAHQPRGFAAALRAPRCGPAIIAELKKASPSKGVIRPDFYPEKLARSLESVGAAALSVLTDAEFFQGSLENLEIASAAVNIPCLRKDFILDPFQILEARAAGADAVLLIVAALPGDQLRYMREEAGAVGLDVLCEVHDREELARAAELGCEAIGVNSRDLRTFAVRPETLIELAPHLPPDAVHVAESGIRDLEEIIALQAAGYGAFLIGEALMRQPDPAGALALLLDRQYSSEF